MITTGADLYDARQALGWTAGLMGRALKLGRWREASDRSPHNRIHELECGRRPVSGPIGIAVEAFIGGFRPSHIDWENL
jgi:hypothetical protein